MTTEERDLLFKDALRNCIDQNELLEELSEEDKEAFISLVEKHRLCKRQSLTNSKPEQ